MRLISTWTRCSGTWHPMTSDEFWEASILTNSSRGMFWRAGQGISYNDGLLGSLMLTRMPSISNSDMIPPSSLQWLQWIWIGTSISLWYQTLFLIFTCRDVPPLSPDGRILPRIFRTSHQTPFAANMIWERFTCEKSWVFLCWSCFLIAYVTVKLQWTADSARTKWRDISNVALRNIHARPQIWLLLTGSIHRGQWVQHWNQLQWFYVASRLRCSRSLRGFVHARRVPCNINAHARMLRQWFSSSLI